MRYEERLPHPRLRDAIRCYWFLTVDDNVSRILPDGCIEIIFRGRGMTRRLYDGVSQLQACSFVAGQLRRNMMLQSIGLTAFIGIRFEPYGLSRFTPIPAHTMTGLDVDIAHLWRDEPSAALWDVARTSERVAVLDRFFLGHLRGGGLARLTLMTRRFMQGRPSVRQVAKEAGLTSRQVQRLFREHVGLTPSEFARIQRFQRLTRELARHDRPLATLAFDHEFSDQAHMSREFRAFAGLSPSQFRREDPNLGALFLET